MRLLFGTVMLAAIACAGSANHAASAPPDLAPAFAIVGDPESATGGTWTFHGRVDGVTYDLAGVLAETARARAIPRGGAEPWIGWKRGILLVAHCANHGAVGIGVHCHELHAFVRRSDRLSWWCPRSWREPSQCASGSHDA
jgi:hypothetical protein